MMCRLLTSMTDAFKRLSCRVFGHAYVEEVFAEDTRRLFGFPRKKHGHLYVVIRKHYCARCGHHDSNVQVSQLMSRALMLKQGWFIDRVTI